MGSFLLAAKAYLARVRAATDADVSGEEDEDTDRAVHRDSLVAARLQSEVVSRARARPPLPASQLPPATAHLQRASQPWLQRRLVSGLLGGFCRLCRRKRQAVRSAHSRHGWSIRGKPPRECRWGAATDMP